MQRITEKGLELIKKYEGFRDSPYICPAGVLTIGYGHAIRYGEDFSKGISVEQAADLLISDVVISENAVRRLIKVSLSDNRFSALVSFTFNLGASALQRSTLRLRINRGEHYAVPTELLKWVYSGPKKLKGLYNRRFEEGILYSH